MKCKNYRKCKNQTDNGVYFCNACLTGLLEHELHIDDIVKGLENAIHPIWDRIKKGGDAKCLKKNETQTL